MIMGSVHFRTGELSFALDTFSLDDEHSVGHYWR